MIDVAETGNRPAVRAFERVLWLLAVGVVMGVALVATDFGGGTTSPAQHPTDSTADDASKPAHDMADAGTEERDRASVAPGSAIALEPPAECDRYRELANHMFEGEEILEIALIWACSRAAHESGLAKEFFGPLDETASTEKDDTRSLPARDSGWSVAMNESYRLPNDQLRRALVFTTSIKSFPGWNPDLIVLTDASGNPLTWLMDAEDNRMSVGFRLEQDVTGAHVIAMDCALRTGGTDTLHYSLDDKQIVLLAKQRRKSPPAALKRVDGQPESASPTTPVTPGSR